MTYPTVTENRVKLEAVAHDTFADDLRAPAPAVVMSMPRDLLRPVQIVALAPAA